MATIVLRVLLGGEHTDLTHEDPGQVDEAEMVEQVIGVLREESGVLRSATATGWSCSTRAVWQASRWDRGARSCELTLTPVVGLPGRST